MTVSSTTRSVSFACNGSTKTFDFSFKVFEETDIRVFVRDADGVETELVYTTNFEVSNTAGNFDAGGTVTTVSYATGTRAEYAWPSGNTLIIIRDLDRTQETDYENNTRISMDTLEDNLDRAIMIIQELDETLARALVGPIEDGSPDMTMPTVAERAGCYLGFNDDGEPVAVAGDVDALSVSSFMATMLLYETVEEFIAGIGLDPDVLDIEFSDIGAALAVAESEAVALTALGVTAFAQTLLDDANAAAARTTLGAKYDNVSATSRVLGRASAGAGAIEELTLSQVLDFIGSAAQGDILYRGSSTWARLAKGTAGTVLTMNSGATAPEWGTASSTPTDASVAQAKLKTSTGAVSTDSGGNLTLPGGEYGFYPQVKKDVSGLTSFVAYIAATFTGASYVTNIGMTLTDPTGGKAYAQQRYVTSSGEVHWVFLLKDKATGRVTAAYEAPDHPCFGNGGKPALVPHPFPGYDPALHEIVVINPTAEDLAKIDAACEVADDNKPHRSRLEVILEDYEIDDKAKDLKWPEKEVTVGLPRGFDWQKAAVLGESVQPVKMKIPQPAGVKLAALKKAGKAA